jgi:hypothetical protein
MFGQTQTKTSHHCRETMHAARSDVSSSAPPDTRARFQTGAESELLSHAQTRGPNHPMAPRSRRRITQHATPDAPGPDNPLHGGLFLDPMLGCPLAMFIEKDVADRAFLVDTITVRLSRPHSSMPMLTPANRSMAVLFHRDTAESHTSLVGNSTRRSRLLLTIPLTIS